MKDAVIWWSLTFSVASFALFATALLVQVHALWKAPVVKAPELNDAVARSLTDPAADIARLLGAVKEMVDALSKASPSVVALISSVTFMAIAAVVTMW